MASQVSAQTGIGESALTALLPIVAAMMMGSMSKRVAGSGTPSPAGGADLLDMLTPMLDSNRDGRIVDDVATLVGRLFSGR